MNKKHFYAAVILLAFLAVGIQPAHSTIILSNSGWSDPTVGTWDQVSLTGTLTSDVFEPIQISNPWFDGISKSDRITLNGNEHTVDGIDWDSQEYPNGVDLESTTWFVTIENLNITKCGIGIDINTSSRINVINNYISKCHYGIVIGISGTCIVRDNTIFDCSEYGIWLIRAVNNTIYNNIFINKPDFQAIVLRGTEEPYSSGNVFDLNGNGNYWSDWSGSGPYVIETNPILIQDNYPLTDTTPPVISCPGNIVIEAQVSEGVPVSDERIQTFLAGASATDNYHPEPTVTNDAPDIFLPGDTTVIFTATDASNNSSTCQSTVTIVDIEGDLRIIPSVINRDGRLQRILAVIRFPEGTTVEDIDIDQPLVLYPGDSLNGIAATSQRIVTWSRSGTLRASIFASFSKDDVTAGVPENGPVEIMVIGRFMNERYFYGLDNVRIISWNWRR